MSMTDPIADLLTRIRNASQARHPTVVVPRSKIKLELVKILKQEGFIEGFIDVPEGPQGQIKIFLRYDAANRGVIRGLDRVSKPGCRKYVGRDEIPRVRNGLGLAILTTPKGVLTGQQALHAGVGGELLCYVW
ncbi:MAG: 30S ribosomal protein S8 [Deltaproteobacteria bacterium]|jgi:small subunit ribosomal protein S8|nr:30S ribosomal protein S8 [Deltaproteobacteria bacterium]MBK9368193.1 30S ribosomal protein S8 [Deltaproteobacteria bacterium]MBK9645190.1 30S ribosomal protein S8 [Deltaproteobacteria bacterium]MCK6519944.1 30S ribosomal protein S8 [Myxococcota bacterium]